MKKAEQKRKRAAKSSPKTQRELATILGISPQLLNYHIQSGSTPAISDVDGWLEFLALNGREGSLPEDLRRELGIARKRLIEAQAVRIERENRVRAGEMIPASEVQESLGAAVGVYFGTLEKLFMNELPPSLIGLDERAVYARCRQAIDTAKRTIRRAFTALGNLGEIDPTAEEAGRAAVAVADHEVLSELSVSDRTEFLEWKRTRDAERAKARLAWCRERAAQNLPVYDATAEELAAVPGLRNRD